MTAPIREQLGVYLVTNGAGLPTRQSVHDPRLRSATTPAGYWTAAASWLAPPGAVTYLDLGGSAGPPEPVRRLAVPSGTTSGGWRTLVGPRFTTSDVASGVRVLHAVKVRASGAWAGQLATLHLATPPTSDFHTGPTRPLHPGHTFTLSTSWQWVIVDATTALAATSATRAHFMLPDAVPAGGAELEVGAWSLVTRPNVDWPTTPAGVVDGDSPETYGHRFAWVSNPLASSTTVTHTQGAELFGVQGITTERGGTATDTILEPRTGTATITLEGDRTKGTNPLTPQVTLRVMVKGTGENLFLGRVDAVTTDEQLQPDGTRRVTTSVRMVDALADLANTTRYGVHPEGGAAETTLDRIHRLMASAPTLRYRLDAEHPQATQVLHRAYVHDSDLSKHLQMVADGALLGWFIDRDSMVRFRPATSPGTAQAPPLGHPALLTDGSVTPAAGRAPAAYVGITRTFDTTDLVSVVTVKRYLRTADPERPGEWLQRLDKYGPLVSPLAATWGRRHLEVECAVTNAPGDPVADELLAEHYAGLRRPASKVRRVRLNAGLYGLPEGLELLHVIEVAHAGTTSRTYVAGIRHTITPSSWTTDLELADPGTYLDPGTLEPLPDPKTPPAPTIKPRRL